MVDIVRNLRIEGDKVSGNAKVSGLDKYTDVTIDGQKITSDGSYNYTPNTTVSIKEDGKKNIEKTKEVTKTEKEEDKRTFWQRHPVLRVLLTIFLCLLIVGLLMIAAYHITKAVQKNKAAEGEDVSNDFPAKKGAFRITGDTLAAVGAAGAIGTGIAAIVANHNDNKEKTVVEKEGNEQDVNNEDAKTNTSTITHTTSTTVSR